MAPRYDLKLKLIIIGDSGILPLDSSVGAGVGKTCTFQRFFTDSFNRVFISTAGLDFRVTDMDVLGKRVHLQVWDTAGQERYLSVTTAYYRGSRGAMVVYDVTNRSSFDHVKRWVEGTSIVPGLVLMVCGNKCDCEESRVVSREEGESLSKSLGCLFSEISACTGQGVREAVFSLCERIVAATQPSPPPSPVRLNPTPASWSLKAKIKRVAKRC